MVNSILSKHTGKTEKQIAKDTDRDNFMDAESALKYGLIDQILNERTEALNQMAGKDTKGTGSDENKILYCPFVERTK